MLLWPSLAQACFYSLVPILLVQPAPQSSAANSSPQRTQITQDQLCCFDIEFVNPIYPREARLSHTEGVVELILVIGKDKSIAELRALSGDPVLVDASIKAVRQWRFHHLFAGVVGGQSAEEIELPLSFTFKIENAPKPAYLHLANGRVVRAEGVREFTNGIEYTVGRHTRRISADAVTEVNAYARVTVLRLREGDCVPAGGPSFNIIAMPLLPADQRGNSSRTASQIDD
jgi:hypothetical protein